MSHSAIAPHDSISVQLYNDLLTGIQVGDYPPLSPLPTEATLAHDYGVSRSVVRSALSVLKEDGIIISRQGSGTIVASCDEAVQNHGTTEINISELKDCYKCRDSMEPDIAAYAAANRSVKDIRYLNGQLEVIEEELSQGIIHTGNDADFHVHLARMSRNSFFETILNSLRPHILMGMNLAKALSAEDRKRHQRESLMEHRDIATAVVAGECENARQAMAHHLATGQRRIFASQ